MLTPLDFYKTRLARGLTPEQLTVTLPAEAVKKLDAVGIGNHTYISISFGAFQEVVRYDHTEDYLTKANKTQISVVRDVRNSGRKTFPCGACVSFEWFTEALTEWHAQEYPAL